MGSASATILSDIPMMYPDWDSAIALGKTEIESSISCPESQSLSGLESQSSRSIDLGEAIEAITGGVLRAIESRGLGDLVTDSAVWQRLDKVEIVVGASIVLELSSPEIKS